MLKLILAFIVGLTFVSFVNAQQQENKLFFTTQFCGPWEDVMSTPKSYDETLLFTGTGRQLSSQDQEWYQGGMFFFVNQNTGSYSIIIVYGDGIACMTQPGNNFQPYSGN